jgi:hypothetical protein
MKNSILSLLVAVGLIGSASAQTPSGDLTNGLVNFYSFNGNANDSVGGNNLNLLGGVLIDNSFGSAGSLAGTGPGFAAQSINNISITGNSDRTVSFWGKFSSLGSRSNYSTFGIDWGSQYYPNGNAFIVDHNSTPDGWVNFGVGWGWIDAYPQVTPDYDEWRMITLSYAGNINNTRIYMDGDLITDTHYGGFYSSTDTLASLLNIHANKDAYISNLGIWNRALSSNEVSTLYVSQSVPEPSTYALFGIGAIGMLMVLRRKKTA